MVDNSELYELRSRLKPLIAKINSFREEEDLIKTLMMLANYLQSAIKCNDKEHEGQAHLWSCWLLGAIDGEKMGIVKDQWPHSWPFFIRSEHARKAVEVLKDQNDRALYAEALYNMAILQFLLSEIDSSRGDKREEACNHLLEARGILQKVWDKKDFLKEVEEAILSYGCDP